MNCHRSRAPVTADVRRHVSDGQASVTHYYSTLSTDELLFILSTKELTAYAKESLERELKRRGVNDLKSQVSEVLKEQEQFAEYERSGNGPRTPAQFFWSIVMWLGIGLFSASVFEFFFGRAVPYWLLIGGLLVFAIGLWMLKRSQHGIGA